MEAAVQEAKVESNPTKYVGNKCDFRDAATGRFLKGKVSNPNGRPPLDSYEKTLRDAIDDSRLRHQKHLINHFVDRAYKSDTVLICIMKKLIADKVHVEGDSLGGVIQLNVIFNGDGKPALLRRISEGNSPKAIPE